MRGERILRSSLALNVLLASAASFLLLLPTGTIAASITTAQDILSRSQTSTATQQTITFITPTGAALNSTVTLTWESGFTIPTHDALNYDFAFSSGGTCSGFTEQTLADSPTTTNWGVGTNTGTRVVTFTAPSSSNNVPANRCIQIKFGTHASQGGAGAANATTPSGAGDYTVTVGGTFGDTGTMAVNIVADDSIDVTATVATSISCTVNNTSTAFGTFTVATVATASPTITWTVSTNASSGYTLTVRDAGNGSNPGLYSAGASYLIGSADNSFNNSAELSSGVSIGYGLQATDTDGDAGSATTAVQSPYNVSSDNVGGFELTAQDLAEATGPVANATVTSTLKAKVSGLVPAGSYVDTLTYICTGIY